MKNIFHKDRLLFIDSVDSSNNYAQAKKAEAAQGPLVIVAREQTNGKGLGENEWLSEKNKNLTLSILLKPEDYDIENPFMLNKITSLSVKEFTSKYIKGKDKYIKWPNDILLGDKKVAGILIENTLIGEKFTSSVIGVGININQQVFPEHLPNPTSFYLEAQKTFDLDTLLPVFLAIFEKWFALLSNGDIHRINRAYHKALFRYKKQAHFFYKNKTIKATITGVDEYGRLCLQKKDGQMFCCELKEINFIF